MNVEREWKGLLDADGWRRLREWARERGALLGEREQTNHYLDTPELTLATAHMMLRLREAGGAWELTFKRSLADQSELGQRNQLGQHSEEVECPIGASDAARWLATPDTLLSSTAKLPPMDALRARVEAPSTLVRIGVLATHRTRIASPTGKFVLELDHSRYGDADNSQEDHELECEGDDLRAVAAEVTALLDELGITYGTSKVPKVARMLAARR